MVKQMDVAEAQGGLDRDSYREAMSRLGAAVSVVTTDGVAGRAGATISAVCSVTDEPPTLLVCLNRSSRTNQVIRSNGVLCVNALAGDQKQVANVFSGAAMVPAEERFHHVKHSKLITGAPVLNCAAAFDCEVDSFHEIGTHTIFIGRVRAVIGNDQPGFLAYFKRTFIAVEI